VGSYPYQYTGGLKSSLDAQAPIRMRNISRQKFFELPPVAEDLRKGDMSPLTKYIPNFFL
jgi:hypothetical protein